MEDNLNKLEKLRKNMDLYKSKLTDKYNRAYSHSKRLAIADELMLFSELYREIFGYDSKFVWDNDFELCDINDQFNFDLINKFVNKTNEESDFYYKLSGNIINCFYNVNYPFYKYDNNSFVNMSRVNNDIMLKDILLFLKEYDEEVCQDMKNKLLNSEFLITDFEAGFSGLTYALSSVNKNFILLNNLYGDNLFKYSVIVHEYGHAFELQMIHDSKNGKLIEKMVETPFSEVSSCFFEYAFLNYLKENKIYIEQVNCCLDHYYKELLEDFLFINLIAKFSDLEVDEHENIIFDDEKIIAYGDKIKNKLNYYQLVDYQQPVNFKFPYIYGMGKLLSIYLYENYKENPNFNVEFRKSLLSYPIFNDLSVFNNVDEDKKELLQGNVLKKVLKKYSDDIKNN